MSNSTFLSCLIFTALAAYNTVSVLRFVMSSHVSNLEGVFLLGVFTLVPLMVVSVVVVLSIKGTPK